MAVSENKRLRVVSQKAVQRTRVEEEVRVELSSNQIELESSSNTSSVELELSLSPKLSRVEFQPEIESC